MNQLDENLEALGRKVDTRIERLLIEQRAAASASSFDSTFDQPGIPMTQVAEPLITTCSVTAEAVSNMQDDAEPEAIKLPVAECEPPGFFARLLFRLGPK